MIVTIDGPAGSGKSTAARELATRLGLAYLDTGAMYRAVTLKALETGVALDDADALGRLARDSDLRVDSEPSHPRVLLDGRDVSDAVRSMRVNRGTSLVARVPAVRRALVDKQRQIGRDLGGRGVGGLVADGRDQGSVVFPDADFKFLIRAALEKRAERRFQEMTAGAGDDPIVFEEILANLRERDATDAVQWAPLEATGEAVEIDTTAMSVDDVVERMLESITAPQVP